ncbi:MAG TPA: SDR family NAD(P)-dependent oxidoreductase [Burkholderiales bacterium]|nr:SDR family NAD(P)-dependent oxidoreductase [Burkholderiales bacterium]
MGLLTGKIAVITGASTARGIGNAIANRFAESGASIYLVAEGTVERLKATQDECRAYPAAGRIEYGVFDLAERGAAERMIETAARLFGRIDVLVNNAGIRAAYDFGDYTRDTFERVVAVNLAAPFFASQAVVPVMRRQGGGRIIHIASQLARVTYAKRALYGLTKAALVHLTKSMAYELARDGIVVNSISPGPVKTQFIMDRDAAQPEAARRRVETYLPVGRLGEPGEIAEVALFLASTSPSYLQGEDICVDGGYTAH